MFGFGKAVLELDIHGVHVKYMQYLHARQDVIRTLFIDDTNNSLRLTDGRYATGRDSECGIPLNPEYRDISRKHLMVDVVEQQQVQLTDVSSLGSFVPTSSIADA